MGKILQCYWSSLVPPSQMRYNIPIGQEPDGGGQPLQPASHQLQAQPQPRLLPAPGEPYQTKQYTPKPNQTLPG